MIGGRRGHLIKGASLGLIGKHGRLLGIYTGRKNGVGPGHASAQVQYIGHVDSVFIPWFGEVSPRKGAPEPLTHGDENLAEIDDTDAVVSPALEVKQRAREDILIVDNLASYFDVLDASSGVKLVDRVAGNHTVTDEHFFNGMGIADRCGHTAGQIGLVQSVGSGLPVHLVFNDRAAMDSQVAVRHVHTAATPVSDSIHERK
jgi:hypothetical protein